jgi:hypothetical protein
MKTKNIINKIKTKKIVNELLDNFEDDPTAIVNNITNEKILNKTISKVIKATKQRALKPIDTKQLIK